MEEFLEKWKSDKRFRTKVKLILYTAFVVIVAIYALSINPTQYETEQYISKITKEDTTTKEDIIKLKDTYDYKITIEIDDKKYEYSGKQDKEEKTIEKKIENTTKKYIYKEGQYYIEDEKQEGNYIATTKDEVYDIVNYNYINIDTINEYLKKATKVNDYQYAVYLKNVILGNDSDKYFIIDVKENTFYVDYTVLMKEFNSNIKKYQVTIEINE